MYKLWERWTSRTYQDYRRSLRYVEENFIVDGDLLEALYFDAATRELFDFLDEVGYLTRRGVVRIDRVMNTYGVSIWLGWPLWEPAVKKVREEWGDPSSYANFEHLYHQGLELDRKRGDTGAPPTNEELRHFVEAQGPVEEELHPAFYPPNSHDATRTGPMRGMDFRERYLLPGNAVTITLRRWIRIALVLQGDVVLRVHTAVGANRRVLAYGRSRSCTILDVVF